MMRHAIDASAVSPSGSARQFDSTLHALRITYSPARAKRIRAFLRAADGQRFTESRAASARFAPVAE